MPSCFSISVSNELGVQFNLFLDCYEVHLEVRSHPKFSEIITNKKSQPGVALIWKSRIKDVGCQYLKFGSTGVLPEHWTNGMLGFPPIEENQHEEEQIYR